MTDTGIGGLIFPLNPTSTARIFPVRRGPQAARRTSFGPIAQLGERYNGIVEVSGSIPLGSTT